MPSERRPTMIVAGVFRFVEAVDMKNDRAPRLSAAEEQLFIALSAAMSEMASMPRGEERDLRIRELATLLVGSSERAQGFAAKQCPDLSAAQPFPDTRLHPSEHEGASGLSPADLALIDEALIQNSLWSWQKVSWVIGAAMVTLNGRLPGIPLGIYAERIGRLVEDGKLLAEGDINFIRLGKVKLAATDPTSHAGAKVEAAPQQLDLATSRT